MSFLKRWQTWSSWLNANLYLDVGSSVTRVVYQNKLVWHQPTCLAIETQSGNVVQVGQTAFNILGKVPNTISVTFPVQGGQVSNLDHMQKYLESVLHVITPQLGLPFLINVKANLALPISTSPVESQNWAKALKAGGFQTVSVWPKPQALYHSALKSKIPQDYLCVIDIGANTTEIAAFAQGQLFRAQTLPFGGSLYTQELENIVRSEYQGAGSWIQMEKVKLQQRGLSLLPDAKVSTHKTSLRVTDILTRNPKAIYVERGAIEAQFRTVSHRLLDMIQEFLGQLPSEVSTALLERGVYLTGGGSQLSGLSEFLSFHLKLPYILSTQPDLDVIWGLADINHQVLKVKSSKRA